MFLLLMSQFGLVLMNLSFFFFTSRQKSEVERSGSKVTQAEDVMHLAVVACGNRLDETLNMAKSALLFSIKKIKFHIFAEEDLAEQFEKGVRAGSCESFIFSVATRGF